MTDPVEYLKEAHRRAERLAQSATRGPWFVDSTTYAERIYGADNTDVVAGGRWGGEASVFESTEDALHIAANSPDKVLARIKAERAVLEDCENVLSGWTYGETRELAHDVIAGLAAGWGWTE